MINLKIKENFAHKMILGSKGIGKVHHTMNSYVILQIKGTYLDNKYIFLKSKDIK